MCPSNGKTKGEEQFLERLMATFKIEAADHIKTISSGLLQLEKEPDSQQNTQIVETIYREAHSLKGAARAVDLSEVETICQILESLFKNFKNNGAPTSPEVFDVLQLSVDTIERLINGTQTPSLAGLLQDLDRIKFGFSAPAAVSQTTKTRPKAENEPPVTPKQFSNPPEGRFKKANTAIETDTPDTPKENTFRVKSNKMDELLLQAEEMIFMKLSMNRRLSELKETNALFRHLKKKENNLKPLIKTFTAQLTDPVMKQQWLLIRDYIEENRQQQKQLESTISHMIKNLQIDTRMFAGMIDGHLQDMRNTLMLPFSTAIESFPLMIRDLSRQNAKQVDFIIKGQDIEIDKRILEEMKAPLIHLVRNALDHGIEPPQERENAGKSPKGKIELTIAQGENNTVEITITDDGAGIDIQRLKSKAIDSGIYTPEESARLSSQEIMSLIFQSEFSTSPIITDLSGRGLGLAIVRETVEKLGGQLTVESHPGQGTSFRILLRMSLATFRGILVETAVQRFVIPTLNVHKVLRLNPGDIKTVGNKETFTMDDEVFGFVHLSQVLGLKAPDQTADIQTLQSGRHNMVVVEAGDKRIGFFVDQVLDEEEVLVKDLGKQLTRVRNISGASILGSGEVVLILNPVDLVKSAITQAGSIQASSRSKIDKKDAKKQTSDLPEKKSILVVEDSITSRMLLKNILESSGYRVRTAVDGMDGWLALKEETFDLAVLDVEMPRLSGLELTERIRADQNLTQLPVILVTSLESREDRERGIDVGADGYIVKSNFDQGNLLEVIKRLA